MSRAAVIKKAAVVVGGLFGVLVAVLLARTFSVDEIIAADAVPFPETLAPSIAEHLAGAVQIATVSHEDPAQDDPAAFDELGTYLEQTFPQAHRALELKRFEGGARLYRWPGSQAEAAPILLLAHMDVVPVEEGTQSQWTHPPFSGAIVDGFVWGRGTMDDKLGVVGQLEAVESLLADGFVPRADIYFAFGQDEEVGGKRGAAMMAAHLREAGVHPELILDEGGAIVEGALPGIDEPVALVGVAEKGYLSVRLHVELEGGHSSMPAKEGSIGVLSAALVAAQEHPMPRRLEAAPRAMLERLAPATNFATRLVVRNLWLLEPALLRVMSDKPGPAATIGTTTALTIVKAGTKDNVLPARAEATLNFRVLPGDDESKILAHLKSVIDDERVQIESLGAWSASPSSDPDHPAFALVQRAIQESFGVRLVAPYLVVGATDARHYADLSPAVYRFLPIHFEGEDRKRMHGTNERISVQDARRAVWFYRRLLIAVAGPP